MLETFRTIAVADRIDRFNAGLGRAAAWGVLFVALVQFGVVLLRYLFGTGSIWLTESIVYAHAATIMLAAAWTLRDGGHVRVDVFFAGASPRARAMIDIGGAVLLLLPFMAALAWFAWPYVARSWAILESSRESSGIPAVFLLKSLLLVFAFSMALQGMSQAIRAAHALREQGGD